MTTTTTSAREPETLPAAVGRPVRGDSKAVLLMAYGSPRSRAGILPYYTHMRGGRPPSREALAELERRYDAIGGSSPLQEVTRCQAEVLRLELERREGSPWDVLVGMKHSPPFIEDAVDQLLDQDYKSAVGLVLAPHFSALSVGQYLARAETAASRGPSQLTLRFITDWHLDPGYVGWLAARVGEVLEVSSAPPSRPALVIFTAHSLPVRLREMGDPYPAQLGETAAAVAEQAELSSWTSAWQSVARTGEPWLGPELLEVVREAAAAGTEDFVICPCGFTADHLEILYDLDIEAQAEAARLAVRLVRTPMPNARADFVGVLADLIQARIAASS